MKRSGASRAKELATAFENSFTKSQSCRRTTGGKGLHVVLPLKPELGWDEVKQFSADVVRHLARVIPQRFVAKSGPDNRVGRIFVDYLRNGRGATTVAAWSARARPGMGIELTALGAATRDALSELLYKRKQSA